jgi:hypothetical protein
MGQWGQSKSFLFNGFAFTVIPNFNTGVDCFAPLGSESRTDGIVVTSASGPDATEVEKKLNKECSGMTPNQWQNYKLTFPT